MKKSTTAKHTDAAASRRKGISKFIIFMLIFLAAVLTFAQASSKSKKAQLNEDFRKIADVMKESYDNGDLDNIIDLYNKNCCKGDKAKPGKEKRQLKKVRKEIRADIYKWMALSYFALDRPEKGNIYLRKLLALRHDEVTDSYWLSIRNTAKNKYYVGPRLSLGFKAGLTYSMAQPYKRYFIFEPEPSIGLDSYRKDYFFNFTRSQGTQLGGIIEYGLTKNLSINVQANYTELKFLYKNSITWEEKGEGESITADFIHHQYKGLFEIPVLLKYRFVESKLKPYLQGGVFCYVLISAYKTIDVDLTKAEVETAVDIKIKDQFTTFNYGLWFGAGIGFNLGRFRLEFEANYKHGLNNIVDVNHRYDNQAIMYGYYDVFDDMKLRTWDLSLNVLLPISFKAFRR
jgi:hypothetical protein